MKKNYYMSFLLIALSYGRFCLYAESESVVMKSDVPADQGVQEIDNVLADLALPRSLGYVSMEKISPGQLRYSEKNVKEKIKVALTKKYAVAHSSNNTYALQFDAGKSILPLEAALPVILGPHKQLRLVDGHHDFISSLRLGARTVPVTLIANLSHLSETEFWQEAAANNYIYPYNLDGVKIVPLPKQWIFDKNNGLTDDPNRYFAAIAARKCAKNAEQKTTESTGAEYPLWVKVGKDVPFIEFMISDRLMQHKLFYQNEMGNDFSKEPLLSFMEKAREILKQYPIKGLKLVPVKMHYSEINRNNGGICSYK